MLFASPQKAKQLVSRMNGHNKCRGTTAASASSDATLADAGSLTESFMQRAPGMSPSLFKCQLNLESSSLSVSATWIH